MRVVGPTGGAVQTTQGAAVAADIVTGYLAHTATTGAATLLTVAAGETWVGQIAVSATVSKAGAATGNGTAIGIVATAGTGVVPTAGTLVACRAYAGANVSLGLSGTQGANSLVVNVVVIAPVGNSVTLTLATTIGSATDGAVDAMAIGAYV